MLVAPCLIIPTNGRSIPGLYLAQRRCPGGIARILVSIFCLYPDLARPNTFTFVTYRCIRVLCWNRHVDNQRRADGPNKKETEEKKMSTFYISHKNYLFVNTPLQGA